MAGSSLIIKELAKRIKAGSLTPQQVAAASVLTGGLAASGDAEATFIGQSAKTFSRNALKLAQDMAAKGATRDEIWRETGEKFGKPTYQDVDGYWKQEISDKDFALSGSAPSMSEHGFRTAKGSDLVSGEYAEAYPDILDATTVSFKSDIDSLGSLRHMPGNPETKLEEMFSIQVKDSAKKESEKIPFLERKLQKTKDNIVEMMSNKSSYIEGYKKEGYSEAEAAAEYQDDLDFLKSNIGKIHEDIKIARESTASAFKQGTESTVAHELQHAIQEREGFAGGGSPAQFDPGSLKFEKDRLVQSAMNDFRRGRITADEFYAINDMSLGEMAHNKYKRLAGEAEARNTQTRLPLSLQERIQSPPWETLDVPEEELVVELNKRAASGKLSQSEAAQLNTLQRIKRNRLSGTSAGALIPGADVGSIEGRRLRGGDSVFELIDRAGEIELPIIGAPLSGIAEWSQGVGYESDTGGRLKRAFFGALDLI